MDTVSMILLAALGTAGSMPAEDHTPPPHTVGLLTPPLEALTTCPPDARDALVVREAPGVTSGRLGEIRFVDHGETCYPIMEFFASGEIDGVALRWLESDDEQRSLAVVEARAPWFEVETGPGRSGWVEAPTGFRYDTLQWLLSNRVNRFTGARPIELCETPGQACEPFDDLAHQVRVLESRTLEAAEWWRVEVSPPREWEIAPRLLRSGWIPSRDADGRPTLWFYSRD